MRRNDVKVRDAERLREMQEERTEDMEEDEENSRKRKGAKKASKFADRVAQAAAEATGEDGRPLGYDGTLLAVIGILDGVKEESNVSGWMRAGGLLNLTSSSSRSSTPGPMKKRRPSSDSESSSSSTQPPPSSPVSEESCPPSSEGEQQEATGIPLDTPHHLWFDHPEAFVYWVRRGRKALETLEIPVEHGIVGSLA